MMLFHHWPLDRATGIAPAVSSLGTKRVAGYTTPGGKKISGLSRRSSHRPPSHDNGSRFGVAASAPTLARARRAEAGAPNGTRTRIASLEDSRSSFELWAHDNRERVDPTIVGGGERWGQ